MLCSHVRQFTTATAGNLCSHSSLRLAGASQGATVLGQARDPYLADLTEREISARTKQKLTTDEFMKLQMSHVLDWEPRDSHEILGSFVESMHAEFSGRLAPLRPFLPPTVDLYVTSGFEETAMPVTSPKSRIAYCRGPNSVFISRRILDWDNNREHAQHLMWHELWHIISRNMGRAHIDAMYKVFGFRPMPNRLVNKHPHRLTNPDALFLDHCITLQGKSLVPLLLIHPKYDCFDPVASVFDNFLVALCEVEYQSINYEKIYDLNGPILDSVLDQVGRNTYYLLHVEEALAENFAMLARNEDVVDEKKIQEIESVIKRLV
jgi:hypothetical protein